MLVLAVVSSKGGAGKSAVAAALAYALREQGARVGLLDGDLDSPFVVEIMGVKGKVGLEEGSHRMVPVIHDGIAVTSFALYLPEQFTGATMHGPMHERWIEDALRHTAWGDLDVLVVDLPAGTGPAYLTVKQVCGKDFAGFIAVAQPNVLSGLKRVYNTAAYHHLRILGVIENMSGDALGGGSIKEFCQEKGLTFWGSIPLDKRIRLNHEAGNPRLPTGLDGPVLRATTAVLDLIKRVPKVVS